MNKQYTIRSIPEPVDNILRKAARSSGKSFNTVVVEALERATGVDSSRTYDDLDSLIGVGIADSESFDASMKWMDNLPSTMDTL